jgi:uncharacterized protein
LECDSTATDDGNIEPASRHSHNNKGWNGFTQWFAPRTLKHHPVGISKLDENQGGQTPLSPVLPFRRMAVSAELLKILVCPLCKAKLDLVHEGQGLRCTQCRRVYPIRDDIPVMLVSEAKIED